MKNIEYSTEKELDTAIEKLLRDDPYGAAIAEHIKIVGCFVVRMDGDQTLPGKGDPVTLKKVPPEMQVFMRPKAAFVLVVDYHFWLTAPEEQKRGFLGQALSRIKVEKTESGLKYGTLKYDIQTNVAVINKYGLFTEKMSLMGEAVSKLTKAQLSMAQAMVERMRTPPPEKSAEEDEDKARSRPAAKKKAEAEEDEPEEKVRPPRRPPPDPEPQPVVAGEEPEPED